MKNHKQLILGTALWGWKIKKNDCFKILDEYYLKGFREIDTATNYPINNNKLYFRYAEDIILEWLNINNIIDLKIIMKFGSVNNSGNTQNNLTYTHLLLNKDYYQAKYSSNLSTLMIHWDHRENKELIQQTIDALTIIMQENINIGISGIKYPKLYFDIINNLDATVMIECKHNIFSSGLNHYSMFDKKK